MSAGECAGGHQGRVGEAAASMRPRHVCRGMPSSQNRFCTERPRFNEAPACLPGNETGRMRWPWRKAERFNEAPACLPGNGFPVRFLRYGGGAASMRPRHVCRGMSFAGTPSRSSRWRFNEAPACLPGNGQRGAGALADRLHASMRPRHVCRGMTLRGGSGVRRARRFNEAPACLPGNVRDVHRHRSPLPPASMRPRHVCRGMHEGGGGDGGGGLASMRPRHVCRGMALGVLSSRAGVGKLQ